MAGELLLSHVATARAGGEAPVHAIATAAIELGWRVDRGLVQESRVREMPVWYLRLNIGDHYGFARPPLERILP
ncbi:hypothetical protein [Brachybacterium tyrofermentans]|uniref:Uncharacterized protein n=1 Tax=Brachybacterium tyrofermentans TaxID=47848 RepID=A0ABW0FIA3_9MICO